MGLWGFGVFVRVYQLFGADALECLGMLWSLGDTRLLGLRRLRGSGRP